MISAAPAMEHQILFVKFTKEKGSSYVNVTNDGWFVCGFISRATDEATFIKDCEALIETDEYKEALRKQRGY